VSEAQGARLSEARAGRPARSFGGDSTPRRIPVISTLIFVIDLLSVG